MPGRDGRDAGLCQSQSVAPRQNPVRSPRCSAAPRAEPRPRSAFAPVTRRSGPGCAQPRRLRAVRPRPSESLLLSAPCPAAPEPLAGATRPGG